MPEASQQRDQLPVKFSFVAPVYNEAESLAEFCAQLRNAAGRLGEAYEIILVNDGSTDDSLKVIRRLQAEDEHIKYLDLSRNFGQQEALTAGYDFAAGEAVISLDADCQHPPELIGELVTRWRQGAEVVYTVRDNTAGLPKWKRLSAKWFYKGFRLLSGLDIADQADFRLLDRKVVNVLGQMREKGRFLRGQIGWMGFRQSAVAYSAGPRYAGRSGYNIRKMARLASAGVFNFSLAPVRLIALLGGAMLAAALVYLPLALLVWCVGKTSPTANLVMLLIGLVGLQLAALGVVGEYIGRVFEQVKGRPIYVLREAVGFGVEPELPDAVAKPIRTAPPAEPSRIRLFT